jgi:hypothetical protein
MEWYSQLCETCTNIWSAVAGKIYVVGGNCNGGTLRSAEVYDPRTNRWTLISDMRIGRAYLSCVAFHGCVYAIGKNSRHCNIICLPHRTYDSVNSIQIICFKFFVFCEQYSSNLLTDLAVFSIISRVIKIKIVYMFNKLIM